MIESIELIEPVEPVELTENVFSKTNKIDLFKELANFDHVLGISRFVNVDEFVDKYAELRFGNGGGWSRLDGDFGRKHKICIVKANGKKRFSWNQSEEEEFTIDAELSSYIFNKGTSIMLIKICGLQDLTSCRPIRKDIRDILSGYPCVVCGTNSQIEIDHKNGLYNDPQVLNSKTQSIDDFQPLCKHCNDQKRQTCVWQKKHNKRYPASMIPQLAIFGINYTEGDETFDETDINALVGTYWYDPVEFIKKIKLQFNMY
jgi:5-methylcytosine-specific restriction endonuclease McrA